MTQRSETTHAFGIYQDDNLTPDQKIALTLKCNDAYARATLRKLRSLIVFAQSEPETIPVYDEDTGEFGPQPNYEPTREARWLAEKSMECPTCSAILKQLDWTENTARANWHTMLQHLPAEHIQPLPWPGK